MSMAEFINDESYGTGSWADDMDDLPTVPSSGTNSGYSRREYGGGDSSGYGNSFRSSERDTFRAGGREERYPPRQQLPLPDKPPYTAHLGNLSWDTTEADIEAHFTECNVVSVRLVRDKIEDRPKGFGYVEYGSLEGLVKALELGGSQLAGRNVRVSVAEPPKDRGDDRTAGEWRRSGPLSPMESSRGSRSDRYADRSEAGDRPERERRSFEPAGDGKVRDFNNWERKGPLAPLSPPPPTAEGAPREMRRRSPSDRPPVGDRTESVQRREFRERPQVERQPTAAEKDNEWRKSARPDSAPMKPTSPVVSHTRPKLELKKRSEVVTDATPASASADTPTSKSNPFGAAKPIDAEARIKEVEERRAALKKEQEEKAKREAEERKAQEEAEKAEKAAKEEAEKIEIAEKAEKTEAVEKTERPSRPDRNNTSPREPREPREFGRSGYRTDRGDRNDRGDRHERFERGGERGDKGSRYPAGEWRRGHDQTPAQGRRDSRQEAKPQGPEPAKADLSEDGWSTVPTKKSRGGAKVVTAS